jgi:outer membrane protein assembly factor BamB
VRSVAATPSLVYAAVGGIGGQLSAYNVSNGVRKWTQHGDGDVQAVAVSGNTVFAGGHFDPDFGSSGDRYELAAMNAATGAMLPYGPQLHGGTGVWAILAGSDSLLVGGLFTMISGTTTTAKNFAQFPLAP